MDAIEAVLRACSRAGDRRDVARLLSLREIAGEQVSGVAGDPEEMGAVDIVDEVFSLVGGDRRVTAALIDPPLPFTMGAKELWEAFPSWCRDTEMDRRRGKNNSSTARSFVCCVYNSACVVDGSALLGCAQRPAVVYRSPWGQRYQLPVSVLDGDDICRRWEEEAGAVAEAQRRGTLVETMDCRKPGVFVMELEQRLNHGLQGYAAQYLCTTSGKVGAEVESGSECSWAASAFVRIPTLVEEEHSDSVTLEVVTLTCVDLAEEPCAQPAESFFSCDDPVMMDDKEEDGWCFSSPTAWDPVVLRRRWSAGHVFQLRLSPTELLLRHDSTHLVANVNKRDDHGRRNVAGESDRTWLFQKRPGHPEKVPLQRIRKKHGSTAASKQEDESAQIFLDGFDLDAIASLLCARVERADNIVAPLGVTPIVRVALPLLAPSPGGVSEITRRERSALVASAGAEVAAMARERSGTT